MVDHTRLTVRTRRLAVHPGTGRTAWCTDQALVPTFRSSCSIAAPTFTNFGKSWALANLLILVPLYRSEVPDRIRRLWSRDFRSAVLDRLGPLRERIKDLAHRVLVLAPRPRQDVEGMVRAIHHMQLRKWPQSFHHSFDQRPLRESVAAALQEQHRDVDAIEVFGALGRRFSGRVKRKADKGKPANAFQGGDR